MEQLACYLNSEQEKEVGPTDETRLDAMLEPRLSKTQKKGHLES